MSELIKKCEDELKKLSYSSNSQRKAILKTSKKFLIKAISEISLNCMKGKIPMSECDKNRLRKYKKVLKKLSNRYIPLREKSIILQKRF